MRFVSMRFAAQTVLGGLGSLQFVVIPFASRWLLGISSHLSTAVGVGVVLLGEPRGGTAWGAEGRPASLWGPGSPLAEPSGCARCELLAQERSL